MESCTLGLAILGSFLGLSLFCILVIFCLYRSGQVTWRNHDEYDLVNETSPVIYDSRDNGDDSHLKSKIKSLEREVREERSEKEKALNRLSSIAAARVRDGNPNVVDLSDQNRPGKLGEQYSELYDNEWTDAYNAIESMKRFSSRQIVDILLQILLNCFEMYKNDSKQQLAEVKAELTKIVSTIAKDSNAAVDDMLFRVKEERKLYAAKHTLDFQRVKQMLIQANVIDESVLNLEPVRLYTQAVAKLCWLMCVQDPPMALLVQPRGNPEECFRAYQTRGKQLAYLVWPTLLLHDGGSFVFKGVAEFAKI